MYIYTGLVLQFLRRFHKTHHALSNDRLISGSRIEKDMIAVSYIPTSPVSAYIYRGNKKNFSHNNRKMDRDLNPGLPDVDLNASRPLAL
jgi:hypothetical protein